MAKVNGVNCARHSHLDSEVRMWVFEEEVDGRKLSEIINEQHENVKYLPGIKLPENVVAVPDIAEATRGANVLVFVLPHQFLGALCTQIQSNVADDCIGVSLREAERTRDDRGPEERARASDQVTTTFRNR